MSDEKQQALFTKWADDEYGPTTPPKFLPQTERYASYWKCWQAALAYQPKPAPVLLTDEQIDAGIKAWFSTDITTNDGKDRGHPFRQRMRAAIDATKPN